MYKKVKFEVKLKEIEDYKLIKTVLTDGYAAYGGIVEEHGFDDHRNLQFIVCRYDLSDLRSAAETLVKAGYDVKEMEAT